MIAAHLGIANEEEINNMSLPFFNSVLSALGKKLNYESVSNLYGNSFCKDAGKYIQEAFPLAPEKRISSGMLELFSKATIIKTNAKTTQRTEKALEGDLGDLSWADGLL